MKHLVLTLALAALVLPAAALGKGPSEASISGGDGGSVTFKGCCAPGTPAMNLAEHAGFFPAVFRQEPDPMLQSRPRGDLGPKHTITYTVPGPNNDTFTIRQDVYPYAKPSPVTYTAPGQKIFDTATRGGWFRAGPELKTTLVSSGGLPKAEPASAGSSERSEFPTAFVGLLAAAFVLVGGTTVIVLLRRRAHPRGRLTQTTVRVPE